MAFINTEKAAKKLKVTVRRVQQLIAAGILPAIKVGRDHIISEDDLHLARKRNRKVGRPKAA